MAIDLRRFSLNKTQVEIQSYSYVNNSGIIERTYTGSIFEWVSVQPYSTIEQDDIFEPPVGGRIDEIRLMYSHVNVKMNADGNAADIVIVDGEEWEPVKIEPWLHLNNEHYRILLRRYDGS